MTTVTTQTQPQTPPPAPSPLFESAAQAIIDKHMELIMEELKAAGIHAQGVVVGVLHDSETSTNWCIADDTKDEDGKTIPAEVIVREIVAGVTQTIG